MQWVDLREIVLAALVDAGMPIANSANALSRSPCSRSRCSDWCKRVV
jgi:hypothetical protein